MLYYLLMIPMCVVSDAMFYDIAHLTNSYGAVVIIAHVQYKGGLLWRPWHTIIIVIIIIIIIIIIIVIMPSML